MILDRIIKEKYKEIESRKSLFPLEELRESLDELEDTRSFKRAITRDKDGPIRVIAEIKHASPIKGIIRKDFDPIILSKIYEGHGASAISVLTDKNFKGELNHLKIVRNVTSIPILCKDFIIDPYQIIEARIYGADAILLIAAILSREKISDFISLSKELKMDAILEVHTEEELKMILTTDAEIIGINNRNLSTFSVDLATTLRLRPLIPSSKVVVSESGINSRYDLLLLEEKGIDAALIGEAILRSSDVGGKIDELLGRR